MNLAEKPLDRDNAVQGLFVFSDRHMKPELALIGIAMGVAFAAPPGVVTAETLRRGARGGFASALSVQLGSLVGDAAYALVVLAGLAVLLQSRAAQALTGAIGILFMLYLARQALGSSIPFGTEPARTENHRGSFLAGMGLSLTNPWAIAFWASLGSTFSVQDIRTPADLGWLFASFMVGSALWCFTLAALVHGGRTLLSPRLFRLLSIACGLTLALFAVLMGARLLSTLV
jgi:threonine/homoserine/homoserine lactone efflux protein